ncbi:MAG: cadherin-like domain-containing protein [Saprospiraceae bacterium]|nr:cadherin-like domain-containing protein [Saprospiraceae bacterium]
MNISKHIKHFTLTLLLGIPFWGIAQNISLAEIYQGQSSEEFINSLVLPPNITKAPANGTAVWQETGTVQGIVGFNTLRYTPNANFVGRDTVKVVFWRPPATPVERTLIVTVLRSEVFAEDDYAYTTASEPAIINVLSNDSQTNGTLSIKEILVANYAENVTIDVDGTITFHPALGFNGIANLSYLVCNEIGVCDVAVVSVTVQPSTPAANDTLEIFTTRHTSQAILLPLDGFILDQEPTKGWVDDSEDVIKYVPNGTEIGTDRLVYKSLNSDATKLVNVTILEGTKPNLYAQNDYLFTPVNTAIEFDLLANDENIDIEAITILQAPRFGTSKST